VLLLNSLIRSDNSNNYEKPYHEALERMYLPNPNLREQAGIEQTKMTTSDHTKHSVRPTCSGRLVLGPK
jgi:hypothetical protein